MARRQPGDDASPEVLTLSVPEAAARLGLKKSRAYELIRLGAFPVPAAELLRAGGAAGGPPGRVRVPVAALERALGERGPLAPELAPKDRAALAAAVRAALPGALAEALPHALASALRLAIAGEAAR